MKLNKSLIAKAVAAVALVAGASMPAFAATAPVFTINPAAIGSTAGQFSADQISGTSSELLHTTATGHYGSGWLDIGSFAMGGVTVAGTGLTNPYQLYVTFDLTDTYRAGTGTGINTPNSVNDLNTLNFTFWADPNGNTTFTAANANGTMATVGGITSDDVALGTGSLITGVAGFNELLGAHLNSTQTFNVTPIGQKFFVSPNPFYNIAFDEFNNTSQGAAISADGSLIAINQASGSIDFNSNAVPEPASLALMGLGMLGLAIGKRRRAK